jgi:hypothetical protein
MISQIVLQKMHRFGVFIALELCGDPSQPSLKRRILKGVATAKERNHDQSHITPKFFEDGRRWRFCFTVLAGHACCGPRIRHLGGRHGGNNQQS